MTWIQTYTGQAFDFEALLRGEKPPICLEDIAHSLSQKCRFGGHPPWFISVAEHCLVVSRLVPEHLRAAALLHDAAEAYTGDTLRPMKVLLRAVGVDLLDTIEERVEQAIFSHFGIAPVSEGDGKLIKHADNVALAWEKEHVMGPGPRDYRWAWLPDPVPEARIYGWSPPQAKELFLGECRRLGVVDSGGGR